MRVVTGMAAGRTGIDSVCSTVRPSAWASRIVIDGVAGGLRDQRHGHRLALAADQRQLVGERRAAGREVAGGLDGERIVAVGAVGVGDVEPHHGGVAGRQEARQAGGDRPPDRARSRPGVAWPTASFVQATAMMRTVPLNCGMSKSTVALPSASSFTGPEKKATSFSVGGLPSAVKRRRRRRRCAAARWRRASRRSAGRRGRAVRGRAGAGRRTRLPDPGAL